MGLLIPIIGMCIPLVAIIMSFYYKIQQLKAKGIPADDMRVMQLEQQIARLSQEKSDLEKRLENIEMIVTNSDFMALPPVDHQSQARAKAKELAEQLRKQS